MRYVVKLIGLLTLGLAALSSAAQTEPVDIKLVDKILGIEPSSGKSRRTAEQKEQILSSMAKAETTALGRGSKDWVESHPNWKSVFSEVRADLASDLPELEKYVADAPHRYQSEVASRLDQS